VPTGIAANEAVAQMANDNWQVLFNENSVTAGNYRIELVRDNPPEQDFSSAGRCGDSNASSVACRALITDAACGFTAAGKVSKYVVPASFYSGLKVFGRLAAPLGQSGPSRILITSVFV
jgi:hypothetical protein